MNSTEFNHLLYTPKKTEYYIVARFVNALHGPVIGYMAENGEIFFRLESDLSNFQFFNAPALRHRDIIQPSTVKFKINGEWAVYLWFLDELHSLL